MFALLVSFLLLQTLSLLLCVILLTLILGLSGTAGSPSSTCSPSVGGRSFFRPSRRRCASARLSDQLRKRGREGNAAEGHRAAPAGAAFVGASAGFVGGWVTQSLDQVAELQLRWRETEREKAR